MLASKLPRTMLSTTMSTNIYHKRLAFKMAP